MPGGKAYGADREYQVLCRDILIKRASPLRLNPYDGDGTDVAVRLGAPSGRSTWRWPTKTAGSL